MREIARQAGVGIATAFRHFPTREALVEAVYRDQVVRLTAGARELLAEHPPARALRLWMDLFAEWQATKHGMTDTLLAMIDAGAAAGDIRADARADDLSAAILGMLAVAAKSGEPGQAGRLLDMLMDGVRPR
jgi:AcrR family transcriptional regulator